MFDVYLHRDSEMDRARKRHVRSANVMRMKMNCNNRDYESRIDYTDREPKRCIEEGWILLPDMPGAADRAKVSEEMDRHTGKESCKRKVHR